MEAKEARDHVGGQWTEWKVLDYLNLDCLPKEYGVYVIRAKRKIPRLKGDSDILYVGQGMLNNRLGKILDYEHDYRSWPYESGAICRINKELRLTMQFSYVKAEKNQCQIIETRILDEYEKHHIELPPVNRSRGQHSRVTY